MPQNKISVFYSVVPNKITLGVLAAEIIISSFIDEEKSAILSSINDKTVFTEKVLPSQGKTRLFEVYALWYHDFLRGAIAVFHDVDAFGWGIQALTIDRVASDFVSISLVI